MCANNFLNDLYKLIEYLIINNVNVVNSGLYHGKMGIAICLCEFGRYIKNDIYWDLAGELLDEIIYEINVDTPITFENGICGIGWGIEYLIRQKYMEGEADEILEELDARVMQIDISRIEDFSIETGLGGMAFYMIARLTSVDRNIRNIPFDSGYLEYWERMLPVWMYHDMCQGTVREIFDKLFNLLRTLPNLSKQILNFPSFILRKSISKEDLEYIQFVSKGLDGGIAGQALKLMKI